MMTAEASPAKILSSLFWCPIEIFFFSGSVIIFSSSTSFASSDPFLVSSKNAKPFSSRDSIFSSFTSSAFFAPPKNSSSHSFFVCQFRPIFLALNFPWRARKFKYSGVYPVSLAASDKGMKSVSFSSVFLFVFSVIFDIKYQTDFCLNYTIFFACQQEKKQSYPQVENWIIFSLRAVVFCKILYLNSVPERQNFILCRLASSLVKFLLPDQSSLRAFCRHPDSKLQPYSHTSPI